MSTVRNCGLRNARLQGPEVGVHWLVWQCMHATLIIRAISDATIINEKSMKSMLLLVSLVPSVPLARQLSASPSQPKLGTNVIAAKAKSTTH